MSTLSDRLRFGALRAAAAALGLKSFVQPSLLELGLLDGQKERLPDPTFGNLEKYLKAYADEPWVYACVSRRAEDVAGAPIRLFDAAGKKIEKHEALDLLENPNKFMGMSKQFYLECLQSGLLLAGRGFTLLDDLDERGRPRALWPLIPSLVEVIPSKDPTKFREGYLLHGTGGAPKPYSTDQIKEVSLYNPLSYYQGLPPLAAGRTSADTHRASGKWNLRFFDNSARPDIVLTTPHSLDDKQRKRMAESWNKRHGGEDRAHGMAFLEKGTKAEIVGVSQKDMDFILQKKMSREELCSVFRTPPALVGLFEYANYANAAEQERIYWRGTVVPDAKRLAQFLTIAILPFYDKTKKLRFGVDESEIRALQEDEAARSEYVRRYWEAGVPMNQLVETYKLPFGKIPGGDQAYVPISFVPSGQAAPAEPVDVQASAPTVRVLRSGKLAPTPAMMAAKKHKFALMAHSLGIPLQADVRKFFDEQRDQVLRAIHSAGGKPTKEQIGIDSAASILHLSELIRPHVLRSGLAGAEEEGKFLRDLSGKALAQKGPDRISKWANNNSFSWAKDINETTLKKLDALLEDGLAEGLTIEEISQEVANLFDSERDWRTLRVAQHEVVAALNEGSLDAYRDNAYVQGKGWLPTYDEATRDTHALAGKTFDEGGSIPVGQDFQVGSASGQAPGQLDEVGENMNCRCTIFPTINRS